MKDYTMNVHLDCLMDKEVELENGEKTTIKATHSGLMKIKCPSFDERMGIIEDSGVFLAQDGSVNAVVSGIHAVRKVWAAAKNYIVEVNIKDLSSGQEYSSAEDLDRLPGADPVIRDVTKLFTQGFKPAKN